MTVTKTDLDGILPLVARGKVRDIYQVDDSTLLFVATDRISAYDVIMENGIEDKGKILTQLSVFWFNLLADVIPNHLVASSDKEIFSKLPGQLSEPKYKTQLAGRSLLVKKHNLVPLEAIVRGYITGSAWKEYKKSGTVHGLQVKPGLQESEAFEKPIFTPSTKAEQGQHDENISPEQAAQLVGKQLCAEVAEKAVALYSKARDYALSRGIILADTKFEFGLNERNELVLVDEVLTPDSSRFWDAKKYELGRSQDSFDKQFLRDWLTSNQLDGKEGVSMTDEIAAKTAAKYKEAYEALTGKTWAS
ncbi:hypothetical protein KL933_000054 [Ogataea haglerorum]|uniref:Phosphoribosylaminoimidazole-succinocarboxamide synthase n=1 Tax=Ogataea haglerorum TaxID=1937702 RepID=A0AAN6D965_9ASCO|nr:hypothetical protein KL915_004145 [Ogataea haglerorum]KAG7730259.1 hypothetical protein KL933_000054 [Ogataea haglerorum]KAG7735148.1 hypothetical protein KL948_000714 [Ogataea haglerorum]KAG7768771.1 hypothetical protein KL946_000054 [Ogataea haglerorum]KAG7785935.1 hypothetical protein KL945_003714 [Ogataea haglerorum]